MRILSVSKYKGNTYCIEIEGRSNLYINEETAVKYHLKEGLDIPESALDGIAADDLARKARERALYLLSVRDYCFVELYRKLEKNYPHELCLEVCRKMAETGLVNDDVYAGKLARELFEVKRVGIYKAKQEMKRRGLTDNAVEAAIAPYDNDENAAERLRELIDRKYSRLLSDEKGVKKVKAALARAGYRYDEINAALRDTGE